MSAMDTGPRQFKQASCKIAIPDLPDEMRDGIREVVDLQSTDRRKGHASGLLRDLCTEADVSGVVLFLRPLPFGDSITQEQLEKWYRRFGFYEIQAEPKLMARPVRGYMPQEKMMAEANV